MSIEKELMDLKEKIDKAKVNKGVAESRLEEFMDMLKDEFGCTSLRSAKSKLDRLEEEIEKTEELLQKKVKKVNDELANQTS